MRIRSNKISVNCAGMSWEIRLTLLSVVISMFSPMWNFFHSERSWPSPLFSVRVHIRCTVTCGLAQAWYKHAFVPKAFAWEVEGTKYVCYLFSKFICGETHARRCWRCKTLSEAIVRSSLNVMKSMIWGSTSRLPPNSRKTSARAEDPIVTVFTRRWFWRHVRIIFFWKHTFIMKSLNHFQNR